MRGQKASVQGHDGQAARGGGDDGRCVPGDVGRCMAGDEGTAVVEFLGLGVLLLIPLVYLILTLGRLQAAAYAADGAAREAVRAMVLAATDAEGERHARATVLLAMRDQGFAAADGRLQLDCAAGPCLVPGRDVTARVEVTVTLPGVPRFVDRLVPARVTVASTQVQSVDAFRVPGS